MCNLVNCLLERAYRICNSYNSIHSEFQFIFSILLKNGYPLQFIDNQIRRFMNKKHQIQQSFNNQLPHTVSLKFRVLFLSFRILVTLLCIFKKNSKFFSKKITESITNKHCSFN